MSMTGCTSPSSPGNRTVTWVWEGGGGVSSSAYALIEPSSLVTISIW